MPPRSKAPSLEVDAPDVLGALRDSLSELVSSLSARPTRASQLADALGIDRNLGWKIWRVCQSREELPSPKHVPGKAGVQSFLAAAEKAGARAELVAAVRNAFERFEEFTRIHGGDRASVEIVLGNLTSDGARRLELSLRRAAFRANSHFLGAQARTLYRMDVVFPGAPGYMPEVIITRGFFGLWRTRANKALVFAHSGLILQRTMRVTAGYERLPLDPAVRPGEVPLLREFCSPGLPEVRRCVIDDGGTFEDELSAGPAGQAAAVDIVSSEHIRNMPLDTRRRGALMTIRTPAELACFDLLLHREAWDGQTPDLRTHTTVNSEYSAARADHRDEIPHTERLELLGRADRIAPIAEVPGHADIIRRVLSSVPFPASEFSLFRVRMRFPPLPICVAMDYAVPHGGAVAEPPAG